MDTCLSSLVEALADDLSSLLEIIIVNDGSSDETQSKAETWASQHEYIRVVNQENGGHGAAVLAGLEVARGIYFKVVDSDDWLDVEGLRGLIETLLDRTESKGTEASLPDLVVTNYIYEHKATNSKQLISYKHALKPGVLMTWDEVGCFRVHENLLMHALLYKTELLREAQLPMPRHTFYVDNIYAYVPLPLVKSLLYLDIDLYHYFIGREEQSVNENLMVSRVDQQLRVTRIMTDIYHLYDEVKSGNLRSYMLNYLSIMYAICSVFTKLSSDPNARLMMQELWMHLKSFDKKMYRKLRYGLIGISLNLPGALGARLSLFLYRLAQRAVKFN